MKTILPRLIDDQTRTKRQCIYLALIFLGVLICFFVCGIVSRYINARKKGLALKEEMKELVSSLDEENINPSNDLEVVSSKLEEISELLKLKESFIKKDVDFICESRKKEYQDKAREIATQCTSSIEMLPHWRQQLAKLQKLGHTNKSILEELATSQETRELVYKVRNNATSHYSSLHAMIESKSFLSSNYYATLLETRKFIDNTKKTQDTPAWQNLRQTHASHVQWVKNLEETQAIYSKAVQQAEENYLELKKIPYDKDSLLKQLNSGKDKCSSRLAKAQRWYDNSSQVDTELAKCHKIADDACNKIKSLKTVHGNYVDSSKVNDADDSLISLRTLQNESLENFRKNSRAISELLDKANYQYSSLVKLLDDLDKKHLDTEEFIKVCETSNSSVINLELNLNNIEKCIKEEDKFRQEKSNMIKKSEKNIVLLLDEISRSLPDWNTEARKLEREFGEIQSQVASIKKDTDSLKKRIKDYRERQAGGYSNLNHLKDKMEQILNHLNTIMENIAPQNYGTLRCSNGVELSMLLKKRDSARELLETVPYQPRNISNEINSLISQGRIYKITYRQNVCSFPEELQKGVNHFDLALNIPSDGYHYVELRLKKDGHSLYKHRKRHIIEMNCSISQGKTTQMSWEDLPKQFLKYSGVILDGNFRKGINTIKLDLTFTAKVKNKRGTILYDGVWQFKENLKVELLVDGKEATVLWAIPETSYPN